MCLRHCLTIFFKLIVFLVVVLAAVARAQGEHEDAIVFPSSASAPPGSQRPPVRLKDDGDDGGNVPGGKTCPPLRPLTVEASCRRPGRSRAAPCDEPQPPGAVASFQCKPLHQQPTLRPGALTARCAEDGTWSRQPFVCTPICGRPTGKGVAFVRNGQNVTSAADLPWHVVLFDVKTSRTPEQICGGSLISTKYFVSAAHCFHTKHGGHFRPPQDFAVAVGKRFRDWNRTEDTEQRTTVERILLNGYGGTKQLLVNDIALVELNEDLVVNAYVLPICVDWGRTKLRPQNGDQGVVVGFGGERDRPVEALQYSKLPYLELQACKKQVADKFLVYTVLEDRFCVGVANDSAVGQGDSGGGIAFATPDRQWFLEGVVSIGDANKVAISLFTNVSLHVQWMAGIVRGEGRLSQVCGRPKTTGVEGAWAGTALNKAVEVPWHVVIKDKTLKHGYICGGTLIKPKYFLTAGHCFHSLDSLKPTTDFVVAVGKRTPITETEEDTEQRRGIRQIFLNKYRGGSLLFVNDLALVEMDEPVELNRHVIPICLDWASPPKPNDTGVVAAWRGESDSKRLEVGRVIHVDKEECIQRMAPEIRRYVFTDDKACIGMKDGFQLIPGDSGNGVVFKTPDNRWILKGVVSIGGSTKGNDFKGLVVLTDVEHFDEWIARISNKLTDTVPITQLAELEKIPLLPSEPEPLK